MTTPPRFLIAVALTSLLASCQSPPSHKNYDGPKRPDSEIATAFTRTWSGAGGTWGAYLVGYNDTTCVGPGSICGTILQLVPGTYTLRTVLRTDTQVFPSGGQISYAWRQVPGTVDVPVVLRAGYVYSMNPRFQSGQWIVTAIEECKTTDHWRFVKSVFRTGGGAGTCE